MTADAGAPGVPRFDVVLRGYDRRQVDEHVARLQRVLARMRADLDVARSQPFPVVSSPSVGFPTSGVPGPGPQGPPAGRPRPTPRPRPGLPVPAGESPDMIGGFTDRMQSILQAAEEEAAEIRNKAHGAARAEADAARSNVADLMRQRDGVLAELTRMRSQLEGLLSSPTARMTLPPRTDAPSSTFPPDAGPGESRPVSGRPGPAQTARPGPAQTAQPASAQFPSGRPGGDRPSAGTAEKPGSSAPADARGTDAALGGAGRSGSEPTAGSTPPASGASAGDGRSGSSSNGSPQAGKPSPDSDRPSTSPKGDTGGSGSPQDAGSPSKQAAHRLPTGAYPAVAEKPASMRPRTEPDPEPGELFRPSSDTAARAPVEPQRPADGRSDARTPSARPGASGEALNPAGGVEATVQVGAVRPSSDDTVLTPAVTPSADTRADRNETPADEAPDSERSEPGGNGSGTASRPASPSRSG